MTDALSNKSRQIALVFAGINGEKEVEAANS
jgi:hypothetical protein